jgi:hypothetical protein
VLQREQSLVNVSQAVTEHGAPLLNYTRTMNRFYSNRKQFLSLSRPRVGSTSRPGVRPIEGGTMSACGASTFRKRRCAVYCAVEIELRLIYRRRGRASV